MYNDELIIEIPEEELVKAINEELQGLDDLSLFVEEGADDVPPEDLEGLDELERRIYRKLYPFWKKRMFARMRNRFPQRIRQFAMKSAVAASQKILQKAVKATDKGVAGFWYHGSIVTGIDKRFFTQAGIAPNDKTNLDTPGKLSTTQDCIIRGIQLWFDPTVLSLTDLDTIKSMLNGTFELKIQDKSVIRAPLSYIADLNPCIALDGSTSAIDKVVLRNSRLERGILKLQPIHVKANGNVEVYVNWDSTFSNSNIYMYIGLIGIKRRR